MQINPDDDSLQRLKALRGEATAAPASATAPAAKASQQVAEQAAGHPASDAEVQLDAAAVQTQPPQALDDSDEEALGGKETSQVTTAWLGTSSMVIESVIIGQTYSNDRRCLFLPSPVASVLISSNSAQDSITLASHRHLTDLARSQMQLW